VSSFLRFIGVVNAAIWFGAAIFFTFGAGPAFFSPEMKRLLPGPYHGAAAILVIERYFIFQHVCGAIALVHMVTEVLYLGRPWPRLTAWVLSILFALGLFGGLWMQPKLKGLHLAKTDLTHQGIASTAESRAVADRSFRIWHGVSQMTNLLMIGGLLYYLWRVTAASPALKFATPMAQMKYKR
jgi:hypothetical protein